MFWEERKKERASSMLLVIRADSILSCTPVPSTRGTSDSILEPELDVEQRCVCQALGTPPFL